jgi:hypothetical protein
MLSSTRRGNDITARHADFGPGDLLLVGGTDQQQQLEFLELEPGWRFGIG